MAKLQVDNDRASDHELINCDLVASTGVLTVLDTSLQSLGANASSAQTLNYVFVGQFTAAEAGTDDLFLRCQQTGGCQRRRRDAHRRALGQQLIRRPVRRSLAPPDHFTTTGPPGPVVRPPGISSGKPDPRALRLVTAAVR